VEKARYKEIDKQIHRVRNKREKQRERERERERERVDAETMYQFTMIKSKHWK
jgi:hypothetical protein